MRVADEANPLMAYLIDIDPVLFLLVKISFVSLSCIILWIFRDHSLSKIIALLATGLYLGVIVFHLVGAYDADVITIPTLNSFMQDVLKGIDLAREKLHQMLHEIQRILN